MDKPKEANRRLSGLFQMSTVLFWPEGTAFLIVVVLFSSFSSFFFLSSPLKKKKPKNQKTHLSC